MLLRPLFTSVVATVAQLQPTSTAQTEVKAYLVLTVPFIVVVYLAFMLYIRPPMRILLISLLAGLVTGLLNLAFDLLAYYAHWWHYTLNDLIFHLPLPFYITTFLVFGSLAYLLIWRFHRGKGRWFSLLVLFGTPIFGIIRDLLGVVTGTSFITWDSSLAIPMIIVMWLVMFYAGYLVFQRLAPERATIALQS